MITCRKCGEKYPEWRESCPKCGSRPAVQEKKAAGSLLPYIAAVSIIVIIAAAYVTLIVIPGSPQPVVTPATEPALFSGSSAGADSPANSPALTATKQAGGKILITVMGGHSLSDVSNFEVRLNGVVVPAVLVPNAGASMSIDGTKGTDQLIIVAKYTNGSEAIVLNQNL